MGELLSKIIPLALGAAISPTVLAVGLLILSTPKRAVVRGTAFTAGVMTILAALTAVGLKLTHHATSVAAARQPITRAIDATFGLVLLLLALSTVLRAMSTDKESAAATNSPADPDKHSSLGAAFVLGMAMMMMNFSTILLYLPAMREISVSRLDFSDKAVAVCVAFLITSMAATLPLGLRLIAPVKSAAWFASLHTLVTRYQRQIAVTIEVIFGAYLLLKAL
ncbi:unannotated protein [freshwater metagenome]|uniref:Unannotated protein n=1 Tax=freshwater metagenome TaxID=449393 RepID=A0A6J6TRD7_9ZZZZ